MISAITTYHPIRYNYPVLCYANQLVRYIGSTKFTFL